ncbi:MAG: phosphoribosyl-AMP cyclohydrolase [Promethearchaeota archaeon]|nr:MAG: phosphoribosyl-AMP cyclohydrolase [Candidatus Lokiarchaeota archaeon]
MKKFSKEYIDKLINLLDFSKIEGDLVPVITQDSQTNEILMLAFSNKEAVRRSLETGYAHYYSRSRRELWKKGETSGHVQEIQHIITDCDSDSLLFKVKQIGAACHKGFYSCFYNEFVDGEIKVIAEKVFEPEEVYKKQ